MGGRGSGTLTGPPASYPAPYGSGVEDLRVLVSHCIAGGISAFQVVKLWPPSLRIRVEVWVGVPAVSCWNLRTAV